MVSVDKAIIARLEKDGTKFEVLVDPDVAQKVIEGEDVDLGRALASDEIFKDSKKGDRASAETVKKVFGTNDVITVARVIITTGTIQLTTDQRKKMQESKKRQIIAEIARRAINPQTRAPHPPQRIELAMDEARVTIDPIKPVSQQIKKIVEALAPLIPIRFEDIKVAIKLSGEDYGRVFADLKVYGNLISEEWQNDGSWIGVVEIPAGVQNDLMNRMRDKTKGRAEFKSLY